MLEYETNLWNQKLKFVAGIDEVGRGALAGPVVAAAVILPPGAVMDGINDSKQLGKRARQSALKTIRDVALDLGIGHANPQEIDQLNILNASLIAMQRALDSLDCIPQALLIDGIHPLPNIPQKQFAIKKGDQRSLSIASASIIAKVTRDHLMQQIHEEYPGYGWDRNVGYPTKEHYQALHSIGPSPYHRRSFRLL